MKKIYKLPFLAAIGVLTSINACKKDSPPAPESKNELILSSNSSDLDTRLTTFSDGNIVPVVNFDEFKISSSKGSGKISATNISSLYNLRLVASIKAPVFDGKTLQATEVAINGNRAYVSYNTQGDEYLGGIDILDMSNLAAPKLVQSAIVPHADVSSITFDESNLYIAGAIDMDATSSPSPAMVSKIGLTNGTMTFMVKMRSIGGYVSNSVALDGANVYVTSGNTKGGITILNKNTMDVSAVIPVDGAKDLSIGNSTYTVLTGSLAGSLKQSLSVYKKSTNAFVSKSELPAGINPDARCNIALWNNNFFIANGTAGLTFWNPATSSKIDNIELPLLIENVAASEIYTNSVSVSNNYVFAANGAAGLAVSRVNTGGTGLEILGLADMAGSANYVKASNGYIYVASGKNGLQIYKLETKVVVPSVPSCEERKVLSSNSLGWYNNNPGSKEYFKGSTVLSGLNVNDTFDFCGTLQAKNHVNINSNGLLKVVGALTVDKGLIVNKNLVVSGNLSAGSMILNSNANVDISNAASALTVNGNLIVNSGSVLKIKGNMEVKGDFTFNGGTIEFVGSGCSVSVKGKINGAGGTVLGTYTGTVKPK